MTRTIAETASAPGCATSRRTSLQPAVALGDDDLAGLDAAVPRNAVVGDRYADMSTVESWDCVTGAPSHRVPP